MGATSHKPVTRPLPSNRGASRSAPLVQGLSPQSRSGRADRFTNTRSGASPGFSRLPRGLVRRGFGLGGLRRARPPEGVDVTAGRRANRAAVIRRRMQASTVRARCARRCCADEQDGCDRGSSHGEPPLGLAPPMLGLAWRGSIPRLRPRTSRSKRCRPVPVLVPLEGSKRSKRVEEDRNGELAWVSESARKAWSVFALRRRLDGTLSQRVAGSIPAPR